MEVNVMFCRKCGNEIPDDSEFCYKCGEAVSALTEPFPTKTQPRQIKTQLRPTKTPRPISIKASLKQDDKADVVSNSPARETSAPPKQEDKTPASSSARNYKADTSSVALKLSASSMQSDDALDRLTVPLTAKKPNKAKKMIVDAIWIIGFLSVVVLTIVFISSLHLEFKCTRYRDGTYGIVEYTGSDVNVVIPDKIRGIPVTWIGGSAFENSKIESVTLGANVEGIGREAFAGSSIKAVYFNENMPDSFYIGESAFAGCYNLSEFDFPDDISLSIGRDAFRGCGRIPDKLKDLL